MVDPYPFYFLPGSRAFRGISAGHTCDHVTQSQHKDQNPSPDTHALSTLAPASVWLHLPCSALTPSNLAPSSFWNVPFFLPVLGSRMLFLLSGVPNSSYHLSSPS